jgi:hypothetical protein
MSNSGSDGTQGECPVPGQRAAAPGEDPAHPAGARSAAPDLVAVVAAPRISGRCTWQVVEGEAVLLDLHGKRLVGLNAVGSFVFPLLDGARTVGALAAAVAERFGVARERAEADVKVFLADLGRRGFVEGIEP